MFIRAIKKLKKYYNESKYFRFVLRPLLDIFRRISFYLISDERFAKWMFKYKMGYTLDLKNPITLNEKIQWLKLYDRSVLHTICADKYAAREFVGSKIGNKYLIPMVLVTDNIDEIGPEKLPDYPVIVKACHGCGLNQIVLDKSAADWKRIKKNCRKWLKENYYNKFREWQYKNIKPRIVVEKLLVDSNLMVPYDYKFHCFNGRVVTIQVDQGRGTGNHFRNWYNREWEMEPFKWSSMIKGRATDPKPINVDKPETLENIISMSEKLAENFIYVRVDWYVVNGATYFGELTFHHDSGFSPIIPYDWDRELGKLLVLKTIIIAIINYEYIFREVLI